MCWVTMAELYSASFILASHGLNQSLLEIQVLSCLLEQNNYIMRHTSLIRKNASKL